MVLAIRADGIQVIMIHSIGLEIKLRFSVKGSPHIRSVMDLVSAPPLNILFLDDAAPEPQSERMDPVGISHGIVCGSTVPEPIRRSIAPHHLIRLNPNLFEEGQRVALLLAQ
jgi:hypothetical protein